MARFRGEHSGGRVGNRRHPNQGHPRDATPRLEPVPTGQQRKLIEEDWLKSLSSR